MVSRYGLTELYSPPRGTEVTAQYVVQMKPYIFSVAPSWLSVQQYRFRSWTFRPPQKDMELKKTATKLFESISKSR